jgi:hypothetical protein
VRGGVAPVVKVTEAVGGVLEVLPLHIQLLKERETEFVTLTINCIGHIRKAVQLLGRVADS